MKTYLRITQSAMVIFSIMIGYAMFYLSSFKHAGIDKLTYIEILLPVFSVLQFLIERGAIKRLACNTKLQLRGNPALGIAIFRYAFIIIAGLFIYYKFEISDSWQSISFSVMVYCFVAALFGTSTFFRRTV